MYSLLPAIVSALFLGYGLYVVAEKGFNRLSTSFFLLCVTTFFWQATWAVLFQVHNPQLIRGLVKFGYLLILFLPTSLYQFLIEISERKREQRWALVSYGVAMLLGVFDISTDLFVNGYYEYFWGSYPKAGPLHPVHVLQTVIVVNRGLYITFRQQQIATDDQRIRLRLCIASLLIYFFAAVDYLCNYGVEFYPPGVVFVTISLGLIAVAVTRYKLMNPVTIAATVAHEMRTPLASIRIQANVLIRILPEIMKGYKLAVAHGLIQPNVNLKISEQLITLSSSIRQQIDRSNIVIDMLLASSRMDQIDRDAFQYYSINACVADAIAHYPFIDEERDRVSITVVEDFEFYGSDALMIYVLYNLLKNAIFAMRVAGKGDISIMIEAGRGVHTLTFTDTATGIPASVLPRIFDTFFTTKNSSGTGIGLAFCKRAIESFEGKMRCESVEGKYTTFIMQFSLANMASQPKGLLAASFV